MCRAHLVHLPCGVEPILCRAHLVHLPHDVQPILCNCHLVLPPSCAEVSCEEPITGETLIANLGGNDLAPFILGGESGLENL